MVASVRAAVRAIVPLYLIWVALRLILTFQSLPSGSTRTLSWWIEHIANDFGLVLPFLLFGSGVALAETNVPSRRLTRSAIGTAVLLAAFAYVLGAWVSPVLEDRQRANRGAEAADMRQFGASTPPGITRNLRFVEANPPSEYSLAVGEPHQFPPNILRWHLHFPVVLALFGVANVFLGALAARLTTTVGGNLRRSVRLAIGVVGGLLFFVCVEVSSPIPAFLRDGTLRPGVVTAWLPLAVPLIEALVLFLLVRRRLP